MKPIILLYLFVLVFIAGSCRNLIPDHLVYCLFTKEDLNIFWDNTDSVSYFQDQLNNGEIDIFDSYRELKPIKYINDKDTLNSVFIREIEVWNSYFNYTSLITNSRLIIDKGYSIENINIEMATCGGGKLGGSKCISIKLENCNEVLLRFEMSDTIKCDYNPFSQQFDHVSKMYFHIANTDNYVVNDHIFKNCLVLKFVDDSFDEIFKVVYSNKYGFVYISKNKSNEFKILI